MSGPYAAVEGGIWNGRCPFRTYVMSERPVSGLYMVIKGGHMERSVPVPYKVKRGASSARSVQKFLGTGLASKIEGD